MLTLTVCYVLRLGKRVRLGIRNGVLVPNVLVQRRRRGTRDNNLRALVIVPFRLPGEHLFFMLERMLGQKHLIAPLWQLDGVLALYRLFVPPGSWCTELKGKSVCRLRVEIKRM